MRKKQLRRELDDREQEIERLLDDAERARWQKRIDELKAEVAQLQADMKLEAALQPDATAFPVAEPPEEVSTFEGTNYLIQAQHAEPPMFEASVEVPASGYARHPIDCTQPGCEAGVGYHYVKVNGEWVPR